MLTAACEEQALRPPPNRLTSGIVIYQDLSYGGASAYITSDVPYLRGYASPCIETDDTLDDPHFSRGSRSWSNCMSSVRVAPGWKATLYSGNNFTGDEVEVLADVPDLRDLPGNCGGTLNDCVSSVRVSRR
jgi:hypothetical protein